MPLSLSYEKELWNQGLTNIIGVDEVGRGCLAGPVVVAATVFSPTHTPNPAINDSKLLSADLRNQLSKFIKSSAQAWAIALSTVEEINLLGISPALSLAISRCLDQLNQVSHLLIDGSHKPRLKNYQQLPTTTIVKGDQKCYSIAAASIIAKVYRDELMQDLHLDFPEFDWHNNKGYGTTTHRQAIIDHGPCPHHRTLFIRKTLSKVQTLGK